MPREERGQRPCDGSRLLHLQHFIGLRHVGGPYQDHIPTDRLGQAPSGVAAPAATWAV